MRQCFCSWGDVNVQNFRWLKWRHQREPLPALDTGCENVCFIDLIMSLRKARTKKWQWWSWLWIRTRVFRELRAAHQESVHFSFANREMFYFCLLAKSKVSSQSVHNWHLKTESNWQSYVWEREREIDLCFTHVRKKIIYIHLCNKTK